MSRHGLRMRWRRIRLGLWNERCAVCNKRMPLNGNGISDHIGSLRIRYHATCSVAAPGHDFYLGPVPEDTP